MKDLNQYRQGNARAAAEDTARGGEGVKEGRADEETKRFPEDAAELAKQFLSAYEGRSESAVLAELLRRAEEAKRAGRLTNADIDEFYRQFSPMLNGIQRKKLQSVTKRLKKI